MANGEEQQQDRTWQTRTRIWWWVRLVGVAIPIAVAAATTVVKLADLQTKAEAKKEIGVSEQRLRREFEAAIEPVEKQVGEVNQRVQAIYEHLLDNNRRDRRRRR